MGPPVLVSLRGRTILVCCMDCVPAVQRNPAKYFPKVMAKPPVPFGHHEDTDIELRPERRAPADSAPDDASPLPRRGSRPAAAKWGGQKLCPVTGEELGSMGEPIPVEVRGRTVYVCCESCVSTLKRNPEKYLPKPQTQRPADVSPAPAPVAAPAAKWGGQKLCPVTDEELGSHGEPIAVSVQGRMIYVCCEGCVNTVKRSPEKFLQKVQSELAKTPDRAN